MALRDRSRNRIGRQYDLDSFIIDEDKESDPETLGGSSGTDSTHERLFISNIALDVFQENIFLLQGVLQ